jgi:[ribosomal protein S18]-alanine N-acetyltransferase
MMKLLARLFGHQQPEISEAATRDAAAIASLHSASFRRGWNEDELESLLLDRSVIAHRAMSGSKLIGFILSRIAVDEAEILSVAVASSRRSRGLARQLLDLHLRRLAGLGTKSVFLEVDPDNVPARRLYQRAAFQEVGNRPGYYSQQVTAASPALVLRRDLS